MRPLQLPMARRARRHLTKEDQGSARETRLIILRLAVDHLLLVDLDRHEPEIYRRRVLPIARKRPWIWACDPAIQAASDDR